MYQSLKEQLQEMFQLDRGDLDFGIYRIMNQKREEVTEFLDVQLLPQVREILEDANPDNNAQVQAELDEVLKTLIDLGVDPETNPKVRELKAKLGASVDLSKMENEIYSDLLNFFKRYYSEGDFMSMRRYKEGVYAMPYEGEEVKLHWANHDQYYIKTSENLKNYTFKAGEGKKKIRFQLAEADTEKNNNKAAEGKERRFLLHEENPIIVAGNEMIIQFEYRADTEKRKQEKINDDTFLLLKDRAEINGFGLLEPAPTEKKKERTLLEKHLTDFTAKNSFDYFIHKDLGKFLRRELDFFIKNEIMHLDDIENESAPKIESYLAKIKALRKVAGKIITFLAQLEDFQKKLWLKKKFVLESHYCITIDHILKHEDADSILETITSNEAQREEWVNLFAIDEIKGYTTPLTTDFLKANDKLLVDTKFYDTKFKYQLLSMFDQLDDQTNGLMINSENFQALNLLQERYREQVKCIYIDPPYNTGDGDFNYKDSYQHSSWISMFDDRLQTSSVFQCKKGALFCNIDDNEHSNLSKLIESTNASYRFVGNIIWKHTAQSKNDEPHFSRQWNYLTCHGKDELEKFSLPRTEEDNKNYSNPDNDTNGEWRSGDVRSPSYRKTLCFNIATPSGKIIPPPANGWRWSETQVQLKIKSGEIIFSPDESKIIRKIYLCNQDGRTPENLWMGERYGTTRSATTDLKSLFRSSPFDTPKPKELVQRIIELYGKRNVSITILDYFAGSGTTGHAVINLNREDQGNRKYILVEMGEYFNSVTKPRIQKVAFSNDWKDGKPKENSHEARQGVSHLMKYLTLEQYEDTLDNLTLDRNETQSSLLAENPRLKEEYLLSYMLEMESKGSASLLNIDAFANPFDYQLRITRDDETQLVKVDLVETFNYLLGLIVETIHLDQKSGILSVTGKTNDTRGNGKRCLILWRNVEEVNNEALDTWFQKRYSSKDFEFDSIYINGDNNIENLKLDDDHWKVQLIEAEFQKLMFSTQDV